MPGTMHRLRIGVTRKPGRNFYAKIGVHNRAKAANWAREHGVV
jgi:DNA-binding CsgD family transcriptional regulator